MKNFPGKMFLTAACITAVLGCSKNENIITKRADVSATATMYPLTVPDVPGYTPFAGIEPGMPLPYPPYPSEVPTGFGPYTNSDTAITTKYLNRTCRFTIDHLEEGKTYHQVNNDKLNMAFFGYGKTAVTKKVRRLKASTPSPYGWPARWNSFPLVENEHPDVLFIDSVSSFVIVLSKPCKEIGFELSPNRQGHNYIADIVCGNYFDDYTGGFAIQFSKTPSGARLMNLSSDAPFTVVSLEYDISWEDPEILQVHGVAIANIRYTLAK